MARATGAVGDRRPLLGEPTEYLVVQCADEASLGELVRSVAALTGEGTIRVLDLVAVVRDDDGHVVVRERQEVVPVDGSGSAGAVAGVGRLLSDRDIALAATAVRPGAAALVLVVEDLWAAPLSAAARRAGGGIVAGERLVTFARCADGTPAHRGQARDVLARLPGGVHQPARGWAELIVDPVEQLKELADLRGRGLLSDDEVERLKGRLLPHLEDPPDWS